MTKPTAGVPAIVPETAGTGDEPSEEPIPPDDGLIAVIPPTAGASGEQGNGGGGMPADKPPKDDKNCGEIELKTDVKTVLKPGNLLVLFDRSESMSKNWGIYPKYRVAGEALTSALKPFKDVLKVGAIFFPSEDTSSLLGNPNCVDGCNIFKPEHWIPGLEACCYSTIAASCVVHSIDELDQVNFGTVDNFTSRLPGLWYLPRSLGSPLEEAMERATEAVQNYPQRLEPLTIIVITDGDPNCATATFRLVEEVTAWRLSRIPTYVVGLPGAEYAEKLLNKVAEAGGTKTYINPINPDELEGRLRSVLTETVREGFDTCKFRLNPKPEAPDKLHLIVTQDGKATDVPRKLSDNMSWRVSDAGDLVELEGRLCEMAKDGRLEGLRFVFGCVDAPKYVPPELF